MEFLLYPTTIKMLAAEINKACDAYVSRRISNIELKNIILHYAHEYPAMLFNAEDLNPTVLNRIGKKRASLVSKMLVGYQYKYILGEIVEKINPDLSTIRPDASGMAVLISTPF